MCVLRVATREFADLQGAILQTSAKKQRLCVDECNHRLDPSSENKGSVPLEVFAAAEICKKLFNNSDNKVLGDRLRTQCELGRCLDYTPADIEGHYAVNIKAAGIHWNFLSDPTGVDLTRFDHTRSD